MRRLAWNAAASIRLWSLGLSLGLAGCAQESARVPFIVSGRLDATHSCTEQALSALQPKTVRLSVRARDAKGALARDGAGKPLVCDATLDPVAGSVRGL